VGAQGLMPPEVARERFYEPDEAERALAQRLAEIRRSKSAGRGPERG
jgi:hypothetical protein